MIEKRSILEFVNRVVEKFKPERVILFGSYASGTPDVDSDVDLLIVKNHRGPGHLMATKIRQAVRVHFPMDLLVRSAAELRKSVAQRNWFTIDVLENGIVLYDAGNQTMGAQGKKRLGRRFAAAALAKAKPVRPDQVSLSTVR